MITSTYSMNTLFITKDINVYLNDELNQYFIVRLPTIKTVMTDPSWSSFYQFCQLDPSQFEVLHHAEITEMYDIIRIIICNWGKYSKFRSIYNILLENIPKLIPNVEINYSSGDLTVNNITITPEIWNYVLFLLKSSYGEKITTPLVFNSPEAKEFYMAQKRQEDKIKRIKKSAKSDDDAGLIKAFLSITYAFPSITFDYLLDQTLAQIHWLQKYAAGAMSYEVSAKAFAAGNVKKGKKLDFFIK